MSNSKPNLRYTLFDDFNIMKALLPILIGGIVVVLIVSFISIPWLKYFLLSLVLILIGIFIIFNHLVSFSLFYNNDYLFLKNRKVERQIPLKNVRGISKVGFNNQILGIRIDEYRIDFINEKGLSETVEFSLPELNSSYSLNRFKEQVKIKTAE